MFVKNAIGTIDFMTARGLQIVISIGAILFAGIHLFFPNLAIDGVTVTLLLVSLLPWLRPLFKTVELPGGVKVEYQDLENAKERADKAGLLAPEVPAPPQHEFTFQSVAEEDPNLALAGLRIEIETRLAKIAKITGLSAERKTIGSLMRILGEKQLLSAEQLAVLSDMTHLLNSAVHGAKVDPRAASWAIDVGPRILKSLDEKIDPPA